MDLKIIQLDSTHSRVSDFTQLIHQAITAERDLSNRSRSEIGGLISRKEVYLLTKDDEVVAFLFLSPLGKEYVEIHSMYTMPHSRRQGYMSKLIDHVVNNSNNRYLAVTFHNKTESLLARYNFQRVSFSSLPAEAKAKFIAKRAKLHRILSVISFIKKQRPVYLLRNN